jgi:hypothetical protein
MRLVSQPGFTNTNTDLLRCLLLLGSLFCLLYTRHLVSLSLGLLGDVLLLRF